MNNSNKKRDFTLFEPLVAILILVVISSIATITIHNITKEIKEKSILIID